MKRLLSPLVLALVTVGCGGSSSRPAEPADQPQTCGNGTLDAGEACDGAQLGGATCESLGYGPGTLGCKPGCGEVDRTGCGAPITCGDAQLDEPEVCDGADLGGQTCAGLGLGDGSLTCSANCLNFDTGDCGPPPGCTPECGTRSCGVDPVCGVSCGSCSVNEACEAGACVRTCDLDPIVQSGTLDLDLKVVTASGVVMVNGQAMPDDDNYERGDLVFANVTTQDETRFPIGSSGAAQYQLLLVPGTYDVNFESNPYQTVLPRGRTQLRAAQALTQSGTLDLDFKVVTVSGVVTINGQAMPDDGYGRGDLIFVNATTQDETRFPIGSSGAAQYQLPLFPGTYDVDFVGGPNQSVLPRGRTRLKTAQSLTESGTLDLDLKTLTVSGLVTVNGQAMPNNGYARGSLVFVDLITKTATNVPFGPSGAAGYEVLLFPGSYDVDFEGGPDQSVLPRGRKRLKAAQALTQSGTLDLDLKTVTVSGLVTVNGQTIPDDDYGRGYLSFVDPITKVATQVRFGRSGAARYELLLFPGTYDVDFGGGPSQSVLPRGHTRLKTAEALTQSGTLDLDLKVVTVSGLVTINGQAMPNDDESKRGDLVFVDPITKAETRIPFGSSGAARYESLLFPGSYDVDFDSGPDQSVLPRGRTRLKAAQALPQSGTLDLDVKVVTVSGVVTIDGQVMPDDDYARGVIMFEDAITKGTIAASFGQSGAARYELRLFTGTYDVSVNGGFNQTVLPHGRIRLKSGCL